MDDAPKPQQLAILLFSIFSVAVCGLTYELLAGAVSSYLLGNSVQWFSLCIGAFMTAMGVGAWLSRWAHDRLLERFIAVEIALGVVGGLAGPALFAAYTWTRLYPVVLFSIIGVLGTGIGLEIPVLTRYLERYGGPRRTISDVMAVDYLGALAASVAFPLVLLPTLGLLKTFPATGLLNLAVAVVTAIAFRKQLQGANRLIAAGLAGAVLLVGVLAGAERFMSTVEAKLYQDPVLYTAQSAYQRIVLTKRNEDVRLYLDGHLQLSTRAEARYHESLVHPALALSANRERVLVLGAGDGMAVREVLKYPDVQQITVVDIDPAMTHMARTHPALVAANGGSLDDPRVTIVNEDAMTWLEATTDVWSSAVIDFPDPHGEALTKLYSVGFYRLLARHLSPGGVAATQATSPYFARSAFWCVATTVESAGLHATPYHTWVPSFGDWGFILISGHPVDLASAPIPADLRWLTRDQLPVMATFSADTSRVSTEVNRIDNPIILEYYKTSWASWF